MQKRRLNWKPSRPDFRLPQYSMHQEFVSPKAQLVTHIDHRPLMSPIVDQGDLGSCTGNAIAGNLEFLELQELRQKLPLGQAPEVFEPGKFDSISRLFIYYNERLIEGDVGQDAGASIMDGVRAVRNYGVCRESIWAYQDRLAFTKPSAMAYAEASKHKVLTSYTITSLQQMKNCLANGFPFVFGFSVYDSFMSDSVAATGIVPMPNQYESMQGGHAVCAVGFDDAKRIVIVRNSWGVNWGDKGYFYFPYDYISNQFLTADIHTLRRVA